jgi:hypothetical protein
MSVLRNISGTTSNEFSLGTVTSGTWHADRIETSYLDTTITAQGNTFNGVNQLVKLDSSGYFPAINGSAITNIGWSNVSKTGSSIADLATKNHSSLTLDGGTNPHGTTKSDLSLGSVENTALSTWAGSSNITTVGTLTNLSVTNTITGSINGTANKATNMVGGNGTTLLGSIGYQSGTDATTMLAPNTTTTKKFLSMTGNGTNGAAPVWDTVAFTTWTLVSKTGTYNIATTDCVILCDTTSAAFTVTLPTAVGVTGQFYIIKRTSAGTNRLTIATTSSQTIDGITTAIIDEQYVSITVISDGSNWNMI